MAMLTQSTEAAVSCSQNSQDCIHFGKDLDSLACYLRQGNTEKHVHYCAVFQVVETTCTPVGGV